MEPRTSSAATTPVILAATDFSQTAAAALDWALELARQQGARIELVHAVPMPALMPPAYAPMAGFDADSDIFAAAKSRLEEAAAAARDKGVEVAAHVASGTPSQVILERAETVSALAVVLGTRGHAPLRHLLGSTTQRVAHGAPCPVLVVHPGDLGKHRTIRAILVPTDFSQDADLAIQAAHRLLGTLEQDARLILLHAFNLPIEYTAYGPIPTSIQFLEDTGLETERRLYEMAQALQREGLAVETVAREGDPARVIAEEAEKRGVDLIVLGTRGQSAIRHLLLGSTAERVAEHAPCPVMTIRRPE